MGRARIRVEKYREAVEEAERARDAVKEKLEEQREEVKITEAPIEALKRQVAGCTGNGNTTSPIGSTVTTESMISTAIQLSNAFEQARTEMNFRPSANSDPIEADPDNPQAKRIRQAVAVEFAPSMLEMWNIFQNAIKTNGIGKPSETVDDYVNKADQDMQMRVSGE